MLEPQSVLLYPRTRQRFFITWTEKVLKHRRTSLLTHCVHHTVYWEIGATAECAVAGRWCLLRRWSLPWDVVALTYWLCLALIGCSTSLKGASFTLSRLRKFPLGALKLLPEFPVKQGELLKLPCEVPALSAGALKLFPHWPQDGPMVSDVWP